MNTTCEVLVIGCGPAGRWLAMDLVRAGLDVRIVAPSARAPLTNTFAVWNEHLAGLDVPMARTWTTVDVVCHREHRIERSYSLIDRDALVARTDKSLTDRWIEGAVVQVSAEASGRRVALADGRNVHARSVVDASGATRATIRASAAPNGHAHQIALGEFVNTSALPPRPMLMDFSGGFANERPPSFGYVLPVSEASVLVEETWLAVRPTRPVLELRDALANRRERWPKGPVSNTEHVSIDLEVPLPSSSSLCVMLGAAAGQVHPATGYSFAASVVSAARLAEFYVQNRDRISHDAFVLDANHHVTSPAQQRSHALFAYGLDGMLRMDRKTIATFFETFFCLDPDDQSIYLDGLSGVQDVRRVMLKLFPRLPLAVQWALIAGSPMRLRNAFA
jgi:lycopene beta-cyclase